MSNDKVVSLRDPQIDHNSLARMSLTCLCPPGHRKKFIPIDDMIICLLAPDKPIQDAFIEEKMRKTAFKLMSSILSIR
jgi:hypothetical protein